MRDIEELIQNDLLFTICLWLLLIVIVCRGVWWIYSNILERKLNINKGIPLTGYTPEEVSIIVRKNLVCPLVEEIGEDEHGSMFFQCKSERYFSRMESGRFYIMQKKRPWINPDFYQMRAGNCSFVSGIFFPKIRSRTGKRLQKENGLCSAEALQIGLQEAYYSYVSHMFSSRWQGGRYFKIKGCQSGTIYGLQ